MICKQPNLYYPAWTWAQMWKGYVKPRLVLTHIEGEGWHVQAVYRDHPRHLWHQRTWLVHRMPSTWAAIEAWHDMTLFAYLLDMNDQYANGETYCAWYAKNNFTY